MKVNVYFHNLFCGVLFAVLILSCSNSNPTGPSGSNALSDAQISISTNIIELSNENDESFFTISNSGDKDLNWNLSSKPEWLTLSKTSGYVSNHRDTVFVQVILDDLEFGDFSGKINITSNGGNGSINVTLSYQALVEVFPGIGAAKIKLGDTVGKIVDTHGGGYFLISIFTSGGQWSHGISYNEKGLYFGGIRTSSSSLSRSDKTYYISVDAPYKGVTEELIGIGSTLDDLLVAYGEPDTIKTGSYYYETIGIEFDYDSDSTYVEQMSIY